MRCGVKAALHHGDEEKKITLLFDVYFFIQPLWNISFVRGPHVFAHVRSERSAYVYVAVFFVCV